MVSVGYARVSSVGQTLDVQLGKLKACDKIFEEKHSGASGSGRDYSLAIRKPLLAPWYYCAIPYCH